MRKLLICGICFSAAVMLSSCGRADVRFTHCRGDYCPEDSEYPKCLDDFTLAEPAGRGIQIVACPFGCLDDHCIVGCTEDATKCVSAHEAAVCRFGSWVSIQCPDRCVDGVCVDAPEVCIDGETRCSDQFVERCFDGEWDIYDYCGEQCVNGACVYGPECVDGETRCLANISEVCMDGEWSISYFCDYACENGVCVPDTVDLVDHRLTGKVCEEDDDNHDAALCDEIYRDTNALGGVCVEAGPTSFYCFPRCDPEQPQKYYCEDGYYAYTGECLQISDGSYALIPMHFYDCENYCGIDTGCDKYDTWADISPVYCDDYENYCEGTIVHVCENEMETYDCRDEGGGVCVQFGSSIWCDDTCENAGDVYYECTYYSDNTVYSLGISCVPDDNGTLTWQYNYVPAKLCGNGCDDATGLCI